MESEAKTYIGVKKVHAYPEERDGKPGYAVIYEDGYKSWSPKDVFERVYLEVFYDDKCCPDDVFRFCRESTEEVARFGEVIQVCHTTLPTGFQVLGTNCDSLVYPFDDDGEAYYCKGRIMYKVLDYLNFVMKWACNGLKPNK